MRANVLTLCLVAGCTNDVVIREQRAVLEVGPALVDFGAAWVGQATERNIQIDLAQGEVAQVLRVDVLDREGSAIATPFEGPVMVDEDASLSIPLVFQAEAAGLYSARLTVVTDDDLGEHVVEARGEAQRPDLVPLPAQVDFGRVPAGTTGTTRLRWANRSSRAVRITGWTTSFTPIRVEGNPEVLIDPGEEVEVPLAYDAPDDEAVSADIIPTLDGVSFEVSASLIANDCAAGLPAGHDLDGDGVTTCGGDCDDDDANTRPGTVERPNGIDDDCDGVPDDGTILADDDGDGYCDALVGPCTDGSLPGDCDDTSRDRQPGAVEVLTNGVDDDCDGVVDLGAVDRDRDGWSEDGGDCDDADREIHPGRTEGPDGVDEDCDGVIDEGTIAYDDDGDGVCEGPICTDGSTPGDCNDDDPEIAPGAPERPNRRDDDCDGGVDEGTSLADDDGDGFTEDGGDCDDADPMTSPARGNCP